MPTSKPSIQVKTYNLEADLGLQSVLDGPVGGEAPDASWSQPIYDGAEVLDGAQIQDLGLGLVLGDEVVGGENAQTWAWGTPDGEEIGEGNADSDLGLNNPLGSEPVGGFFDTEYWLWGGELPEAAVGELFFVLVTELGEYITLETGELIRIE
jgi:hypothetical protein